MRPTEYVLLINLNWLFKYDENFIMERAKTDSYEVWGVGSMVLQVSFIMVASGENAFWAAGTFLAASGHWKKLEARLSAVILF